MGLRWSRSVALGMTVASMGLIGGSAAPPRTSVDFGEHAPVGRPQSAEAAPAAYGHPPLSFEENRGQAGPETGFVARGTGFTLALSPDGSAVGIVGRAAATTMRLVGADTGATSVGQEARPGTANYLRGDDPDAWHTGIPTYGRVTSRSVYPGIDVAYYGAEGGFEYDFIVAPGADPGAIAVGFDGAEGLRLNPAGDLVVTTPGGDLVQRAPVIYQESGDERRLVAGRFEVGADNRVRFGIADYDRTRPLVIDPVVAYSTYLGGSNYDVGDGIAVDGAGNAYVTGYTASPDFPTTAGLDRTVSESDAFVTKLSRTGTVVYSTYLGGTDIDFGQGIDVDDAGSAYVTGYTLSSDFPTTAGLDRIFGGITDAFVTKFEVGATCNGRVASIVGTAGNDTIVGTAGADVIAGLGGNDTITGGGGNDIICGGSGNDTIAGQGGNDRLDGGGGADELDGGAGDDRLIGAGGDDDLTGGDGLDVCRGGTGSNTTTGCES